MNNSGCANTVISTIRSPLRSSWSLDPREPRLGRSGSAAREQLGIAEREESAGLCQRSEKVTNLRYVVKS